MPARASSSQVPRPCTAGVPVEGRRTSDGGQRFPARYTDPRGERHAVRTPDGGGSWADGAEAFAAACTAQAEAARLSYRSREGERLLFGDLVRDHYLPSLWDGSPNTRGAQPRIPGWRWRGEPRDPARAARRPPTPSRCRWSC